MEFNQLLVVLVSETSLSRDVNDHDTLFVGAETTNLGIPSVYIESTCFEQAREARIF